MAELTYRQASQDDAPAIAAVARVLWQEMGEKSGLSEPFLTGEGVAARLAGYGASSAMFVCREEEGVVGFAVLQADVWEEGAAVMGVWVLPSARRRGIGRELALMALEFARGAGYRKLRGTLPQNNEAALSFFSEIGALAQVVGWGMQYELPL